MYNYNFKIHFKNVPSNVGRYHIHCPEHISFVHKLGVPQFKITKVDIPQISQNNDLASMTFYCKTLGKNLCVHMSSRNRNESVLEFYDKHASNNFWALGFDQSSMLRLKFNVENDDDDSHDLNVSFAFCNPLLLPIVPLFPLFVFINKLEDKLYLKNLSRDHTQVIGTDWIMNDSRTCTMFSLYRLYIYFIYLNSQLKN